jgi:hypothetical protein
MQDKEKRKVYYKNYQKTHKAEAIAYREAHKAKINARNKAYYETLVSWRR